MSSTHERHMSGTMSGTMSGRGKHSDRMGIYIE
jgi:hypothetical protein